MNFKEEKTKLIIDWEDALSEILTCIKNARKTIRFRVYMWRDDESWRKVLEALQEKIKACSEMKIYIEKDVFWWRVYNLQKYFSIWKVWWDIFSTKKWSDFIKKNKNVLYEKVWSESLIFFKYLKENNHSKVFLFDENTPEATAIIWWMNIADEYLTAQNHENPDIWWWHDFMVKIRWEPTQKLIWKNYQSKKWIFKKIAHSTEILLDIKNKRTIMKEIFKELKNAKKSIIIEHWYMTDLHIISKLRKISRKWVNIKVILPNRSDWVYHANMNTISKLLKPSLILHKINKNLEVYLYNWMIHSKTILIDDEIAILWSSNLTYNSFNILCETNAVFKNWSPVVKQLKDELNKDLLYSERIQIWNIPKYKKWLAWIQELFI